MAYCCIGLLLSTNQIDTRESSINYLFNIIIRGQVLTTFPNIEGPPSLIIAKKYASTPPTLT